VTDCTTYHIFDSKNTRRDSYVNIHTQGEDSFNECGGAPPHSLNEWVNPVTIKKKTIKT